MNGMVIWKFLAIIKLWKILGKICFSKQIFYRKQSLGVADICYRQQETTQIVSASMLAKLKSSKHFINDGGKD